MTRQNDKERQKPSYPRIQRSSAWPTFSQLRDILVSVSIFGTTAQQSNSFVFRRMAGRDCVAYPIFRIRKNGAKG